MRLSFVVPAYNEEAYLPACIESILSQAAEYPGQIEVIVVNNASTDRTREVALGYPGVTLVDEMRKGLTFARQAGFDASSGELIANVDSDARLTPGWIAQVLSTFDADAVAMANHTKKRPLVALSGPQVFYDLPRRRRVIVHLYFVVAKLIYFTSRYILRVGSMVQGGNFVLSRTALEQIGGFNTAISFYGEDTDIARRLSAVGEVRFTFNLKISTSARRLNTEGLVTMGWRYFVNYVWTTFFKRPYTDEYLDIRESPAAEGLQEAAASTSETSPPSPFSLKSS
jgi:glycosyltransferase involved in cell wall biosynthesis